MLSGRVPRGKLIGAEVLARLHCRVGPDGPRRLSSVGQSDAFVMRRSSVRFRQAAPINGQVRPPVRLWEERRRPPQSAKSPQVFA
jgi:hypothetical protein